jgi:hypothetical protein
MAPEFYTGAPVDCDDLWFRDPFIEQIKASLQASHVLLSAPRRTGKTSVMDFLAQNPGDRFRAVSVNAQDLAHPADLFHSILDALHDTDPRFVRDMLANGWSWLANTCSQLKEVSGLGFKLALRETDPNWKTNWQVEGAKFVAQVRQHADRLLIIIDELPDMLLNMQREDPELLQTFLQWWRKHRLQPHPKDDQIRWLVGGSINLKSSLDSLGFVDLINDFDDLPLPVLTNQQVAEFVTKMLRGRDVDFEKTVPKRIIERLGQPIPLFMQMATQNLYRLWKKRPIPKSTNTRAILTVADVDHVFDELIRSSAAKDKLKHYYSRIQRYYSEPSRSVAYEILSKISSSEADVTRQALLHVFDRVVTQAGLEIPQYQRKQDFNQLLDNLENDFYVAEVSDGVFDFASGVMKSWWRKYYA